MSLRYFAVVSLHPVKGILDLFDEKKSERHTDGHVICFLSGHIK